MPRRETPSRPRSSPGSPRSNDDNLLRRVARQSAHLFTANSLALALSLLMGVLSARLLGVAGFGLIGAVMAYASTVNSILSFRMSELVVRYAGEYLENGETEKAAALIKVAGRVEAGVSLLAFVMVASTSALASRHIAKTEDAAWMFSFFAIGLLANFNYETSIGVLQITNKIKLQGTVNLIQSAVGALTVGVAFLWGGALTVFLAYLFGKIILGLGVFILARIQLNRVLGSNWRAASIKNLSSPRELIRFAVSSNVSATLIKIFRESELVWVAFFLTPLAVGYYRAAYMIIGLLSVTADPLIATVYPELNRLVAQKTWPRLRDFLKKITAFSFAFNLVQALALVFLGRWILSIFRPEYVPAYPALMALLAGMAFNYTLFWNRPLLLSLNLPEYPIKVTLIVGVIKVALMFALVPRYGIVAAGALLSFYYIATVGIMAWRGVKEIR